MIVGCVTPAIIVAGVTGASREDQIILIRAALLITAVATLIQVFPVHKYCGSGLHHVDCSEPDPSEGRGGS